MITLESKYYNSHENFNHELKLLIRFICPSKEKFLPYQIGAREKKLLSETKKLFES